MYLLYCTLYVNSKILCMCYAGMVLKHTRKIHIVKIICKPSRSDLNPLKKFAEHWFVNHCFDYIGSHGLLQGYVFTKLWVLCSWLHCFFLFFLGKNSFGRDILMEILICFEGKGVGCNFQCFKNVEFLVSGG